MTLLRAETERTALLLDELAAMSRSGISWNQGLRQLSGSGAVGRAADQLRDHLDRGLAVDEALAAVEVTWGNRKTESLRAFFKLALRSNPAEAFSGLAMLLRLRGEYRRQMRAALIYPLVVIVAAYVALLCGAAMLPNVAIFTSRADSLAPLARWLLDFWWLPPVLALGFTGVFAVGFRAFSHLLPLAFQPWLYGRLAWEAELLALAIEHRVPVDEALALSQGAVAHPVERGLLRWFIERLRDGTAGRVTDKPAVALREIAALYWQRSQFFTMATLRLVPVCLLIIPATVMLAIYLMMTLVPMYQSLQDIPL